MFCMSHLGVIQCNRRNHLAKSSNQIQWKECVSAGVRGRNVRTKASSVKLDLRRPLIWPLHLTVKSNFTMPLSPSSGPTCSWCRSQDGIRHRRHALEGSRRWWRCRSDEDAHLGCLEHSSTDRGVLLGHDGDVAHLHRQWWSVWQVCFVEDRVVLSEHTSSSYTVFGSCSTGTHVLSESTCTGTFKYFRVTSISYNESTWTKFMQI